MTHNYKDVERRTQLDHETFVHEFCSVPRPVVISGGAKTWRAFREWTSGALAAKYGAVAVPVKTLGSKSRRSQMTITEYVEYLRDFEAGHNTELRYLVDWQFAKSAPELLSDIRSPEFVGQDWFSLLPSTIQPDYRWIYIGVAGTFGPLHVDLQATSAWLAVIDGKKEVVFFEPNTTQHVYKGAVNPFNPDFGRFPEFAYLPGYRVILEPGDIIYVPTGWWHAARNLTTCIAVTQNFLSYDNAAHVSDHLASQFAMVEALRHTVSTGLIRSINTGARESNNRAQLQAMSKILESTEAALRLRQKAVARELGEIRLALGEESQSRWTHEG